MHFYTQKYVLVLIRCIEHSRQAYIRKVTHYIAATLPSPVEGGVLCLKNKKFFTIITIDEPRNFISTTSVHFVIKLARIFEIQ